MLDRFDQDELLAYIEGELGPDEAARLEHELGNLPRAAMQVERLRRDRELLRGDREPELPRNFLTSIESRLARPMLMETLHEVEEAEAADPFYDDAPAAKPGVMRRQRRLTLLRKRLTKLAVAAMLMLGLGAGIWTMAVTTNIPDHARNWLASTPADERQQTPPGQVAEDREDASETERIMPDDGEFAWPAGAIVHHAPRRGTFSGESGAGAPDADDHAEPVGDRFPSLDVLLVIRAADPAAFESSLAEVASSLEAPTALVQNFSYEEASQLAAAWARQEGRVPDRSGTRPPTVAGTNGRSHAASDRMSRLADDARRELRRAGGSSGVEAVEQSRHLAGTQAVAATFAQQLDYSSRGATHTISVPAGRLHEVLAALDRSTGSQATLVRLPEAAWADATDRPMGRSDWLSQRRELQALLVQLDRMDADAIIHLPVRVDRASNR